MKAWLKTNQDRVCAWMIGLGFVLFAVHNPAQPLIEYAFLPIVGLAISLVGIMIALTPSSGEKRMLWRGLYYTKPSFGLGDRRIYIPLIIIATSIAVSGFVNGVTFGEKVAPMAFAFYLFGAYLACRRLGSEIYRPFMVAVVAQAVSCVVYGAMYPGMRAGGLIGWTSAVPTGGLYSMSAVFLIFGAMVSVFWRRWVIFTIAVVGLFFTGAEMAAFGLGILALAMLIRRDWSRRALIPLACVVALVGAGFATGVMSNYIRPAEAYINAARQIPYAETVEERDALLDRASNNRWTPYKAAFAGISPAGHGYNITAFYKGIPHNVPLIIAHQVGPAASVAWLFLMFYCLKRTKWKYAFTAVLALSVFDHALWTQVAPWCWGLVGVASSGDIPNDFIFKKA